MIERHITFVVKADKSGDFERFFAERYRTAMSESPGFVRVELLREGEDASRYQMMLRFEDAHSSLTWRSSPIHQGLQPDLTALISSSEVQGYDVIV